MEQLTHSVKTAYEMLQEMGADIALVVASDRVGLSASTPPDNRATAFLILGLLDRAPKEVSELVKEYLNEGGRLS